MDKIEQRTRIQLDTNFEVLSDAFFAVTNRRDALPALENLAAQLHATKDDMRKSGLYAANELMASDEMLETITMIVSSQRVAASPK